MKELKEIESYNGPTASLLSSSADKIARTLEQEKGKGQRRPRPGPGKGKLDTLPNEESGPGDHFTPSNGQGKPNTLPYEESKAEDHLTPSSGQGKLVTLPNEESVPGTPRPDARTTSHYHAKQSRQLRDDKDKQTWQTCEPNK